MANDITRKVKLDTKDAIRNLGDLIDRTEDAESAGKQLADALHASADEIEAEMRDIATTADMLGNALGPELRAKAGDNGLVQMVTDLRNAGLTCDEIRADVDQLAGAIQHLDTVGSSLDGPKRGLQDVSTEAERTKGSLGGMRGEADQSRSVMANMVGNSAQDIGELGGIAGTTGVALGQLGEYAADGNIKLSGLAKVAGPMAGLTVVTLAISQGAKQAAQRAKELQQAFKDLSTATDQEVLRSVSTMFLTMALDGKDATATFREMADTNIEGTRRLRELAEAAGYSDEFIRALSTAIDEHERKAAQAEETHRRYGDEVKESTAAVAAAEGASKAAADGADILKTATEGVARETERAKEKADDYADSLRKQREQTEELYATERSAVDAKFAYRDATEEAKDKVLELDAVLADNKTTVEEQDAAIRSARDAALEASEKYATMNGAALDSEGGIRRQIESLEAQRDSLAPDSPLRKYLQEYIDALNNIPSNVSTALNLSISQGQVTTNQGDVIGVRTGAHAGGGRIPRNEGLSLVGERGPELISAPGAQVFNAAQTAAMLNGGGGNTIVINVSTGPFYSQSDLQRAGQMVANALAAYARRGGVVAA